MKRLLIIADGPLEAELLRRALRYSPECDVIGFADVRRPCGWTVRDTQPDVILVNDVGTPALTLSRLREARAGAAEATIVCRTAHDDPTWPRAAADAGADATVDATIDSVRMALLVREIAAGSVFHTPRVSREEPPHVRDAVAGLTARELEILQLMAAGATNSGIARQLWVTEQTVKFHLSNTYRKLGVANRTEASHFAHVHGLLDQPRSPSVGTELVPAPVAA